MFLNFFISVNQQGSAYVRTTVSLAQKNYSSSYSERILISKIVKVVTLFSNDIRRLPIVHLSYLYF